METRIAQLRKTIRWIVLGISGALCFISILIWFDGVFLVDGPYSSNNFRAIEYTTPGGNHFLLYSKGQIGFAVAQPWPEAPGFLLTTESSRSDDPAYDILSTGPTSAATRAKIPGALIVRGFKWFGFGALSWTRVFQLGTDGQIYRPSSGVPSVMSQYFRPMTFAQLNALAARLNSAPIGITEVCVPYWIPVLLFAMPLALVPLLALRRRLQSTGRLTKSKCLNCDYDLRATAERCPECGTPVPAQWEIHAAREFRQNVAAAPKAVVKHGSIPSILFVYLAVGLVVIGFLENPPTLHPTLVDLLALLLILSGVFKTAKYRRWPGVFLRFGFISGIAAMLLPPIILPANLWDDSQLSAWRMMLEWTPCILAAGFSSYFTAALRWRLLSKPTPTTIESHSQIIPSSAAAEEG